MEKKETMRSVFYSQEAEEFVLVGSVSEALETDEIEIQWEDDEGPDAAIIPFGMLLQWITDRDFVYLGEL